MTVWNNKAFSENELSRVGKIAVILLLVIPVCYITIKNIIRGAVSNPYAFIISLVGLAFFLISKISVILKGRWISFGTNNLSENMANFYRLGYWLMAVGLIFTFFKE